MAELMKRPGGELASRPLNFFWIVDCRAFDDRCYGRKLYSSRYIKADRAITY